MRLIGTHLVAVMAGLGPAIHDQPPGRWKT